MYEMSVVINKLHSNSRNKQRGHELIVCPSVYEDINNVCKFFDEKFPDLSWLTLCNGQIPYQVFRFIQVMKLVFNPENVKGEDRYLKGSSVWLKEIVDGPLDIVYIPETLHWWFMENV
jgi:hypothetical protein